MSGALTVGQIARGRFDMDRKDMKKLLAGLCITSLVAGASLTAVPGGAGAASG